jgi:predicted aconitase with swiveling domain
VENLMLRGRARTKGMVEAEAIVSDVPFGFWHGIDPSSGVIINQRHPLYGETVRNKVFVFPYGRGSTGNPGVFLEAVRNGAAPAGIINITSEPMIIVCSILAEACYQVKIPVIDGLDQDPIVAIRTGDTLRVDGERGIVQLTRK